MFMTLHCYRKLVSQTNHATYMHKFYLSLHSGVSFLLSHWRSVDVHADAVYDEWRYLYILQFEHFDVHALCLYLLIILRQRLMKTLPLSRIHHGRLMTPTDGGWHPRGGGGGAGPR